MHQREGTLQAAPHPMPGYVAVVPIPGTKEDKPEEDDRGLSVIQQLFPGVMLASLGGSAGCRGVVAAIVIDVTEIPEAAMLTPYSAGCKVFYHEHDPTVIGDYTYVSVKSVIAWEPE